MRPVVLGYSAPVLLLLASAAGPGCTGTIMGGREGDGGNHQAGGGNGPAGGGDGVSPPNTPGDPAFREPFFACANAAPSKQQPLRRLTRLQFINTVNDVVKQMAGGAAASVLTTVQSQLDKLPPDKYTSAHNKGRDGFSSADQEVTQLHADVDTNLAIGLGKALTDTVEKRRALFGDCATDATTANDVSCVDAFVRKWGPRILRGPVTDEDVAFYRQAMRGTAASPEALADVVGLLFAAPRFFFLVESQTGVAALPAHELANRLSYLLWDAPPDDLLLAAVTDGSLAKADGFRAQVERLLDSPRAATTMERFFREWFSLYTTPDLTAALKFADYKALVAADQPTTAATAGMIDDVLGLVRDVYSAERPMMDVLTERRAYTQDPYVASVYGITAGAGPAMPPSDARVGLITRPAFLASGDYSTHPILKGVRLRSALLCDPIADPPADAFTEAEAARLPEGPVSQRVQAEVRTDPPGCAGCHTHINPLGFATENFDSLGRERAIEMVFDKNGALVGELPIDTAIVPNVDDRDTEPVAGAEGVMKSIIRSRKVEACYARQYFRFSFGKIAEDLDADGCLLSQLEAGARAGGTLRDLVVTLVESPEFSHRRVD